MERNFYIIDDFYVYKGTEWMVFNEDESKMFAVHPEEILLGFSFQIDRDEMTIEINRKGGKHKVNGENQYKRVLRGKYSLYKFKAVLLP